MFQIKMSSTLVELRPDRRLMDHEFEGYKLNLQALPHYSHELTAPVDRLFPDEVQYSFVHAKLFALHNHLVPDYWDFGYNFYYIDDKQQVRLVSFDSTTHAFQNTVVYDVPAHVERKSGHFNLCLSFPSSNLAVVSDGTGYLHIIETGQRSKEGHSQKWQTLHSSLVLGEDEYVVIVDTRFQESDNKEILHCLLQSVEQNDSHFYSILTWVKFELDGKNCKQISMKQMQGKGIVHYAAIETSCSALFIASDNPFKFTLDTEKDINEKPKIKESQRNIIYTWLQTMEDITITLKLQENFDKSLLHVNITPLAVKISYAGKNFVDGRLEQKIDSELTTWNVQDNGQVDILITKSESMLWGQLIEGGDPNGEQIMDASLVEEAHRRLEHLCMETEVDESGPSLSLPELDECDVASEEDTVLVRIDAETHETSHRIPLSVYQFLFDIKLETNEVPALALRHDVDACIWQPYAELVNSSTWPVKHQGTLLAFGYVQSSKTNRKFITCPPNFSYSVVCEASKHIFIYRSGGNQDSQLRQRTGGMVKTVKVGQQHVFNVDKYGEVLGVNATNDYLFVLTQESFVVVGMQ